MYENTKWWARAKPNISTHSTKLAQPPLASRSEWVSSPLILPAPRRDSRIRFCLVGAEIKAPSTTASAYSVRRCAGGQRHKSDRKKEPHPGATRASLRAPFTARHTHQNVKNTSILMHTSFHPAPRSANSFCRLAKKPSRQYRAHCRGTWYTQGKQPNSRLHACLRAQKCKRQRERDGH